MSSSDDKLPTSTLARSFSAQLNDIFLLDDILSSKEQEVEKKKLDLTQQNAELEALEARLKAAEARLAKQSKRMSLISPESAPTPANTEVGNPLSPSSSTRRRNPIPVFQSPEEQAAQEANDTPEAGDGVQDIADDSAPEPPKKDNPVALQAPRALPAIDREIEAPEEEEKNAEEEEWGGGKGEQKGGGGMGRYDGGDDEDDEDDTYDIGAASNTSLFAASTFANPIVPKHDKIQITSFLEKELPKLSDGQGQQPGPATTAQDEPQSYARADEAQHHTNFPIQDEYETRNRSLDPEHSDTRNSDAASTDAFAASISGQHPITVKPDEDGDEVATGDLIDQYGYDTDEEDGIVEEHPETTPQLSGHISLTSARANESTHTTRNVSHPPVSVTRPDRSDSLNSPAAGALNMNISTVPTTSNTQEESENTKFIVDDGWFTQPRRAPTINKTQLPPLPGQTPDIPKRKPVRGSEENSRAEITALQAQAQAADRPPTPPSKAPRGIANSDHHSSILSIATDNRSYPSTTSMDSTHTEKPLPPTSPSEASLDGPTRELAPERGFGGGLLKMKKSLQGLRKKAQMASSPISPPSDHRSFSTGALGHYPASDPKPKDEPPLPPIPPAMMNPPTPPIMVNQYRVPTPPEIQPQQAPQTDLFDRIQASLPNQQQEEPSPRRFEGKQRKAVEAIAKFSGKLSALRSLRRREAKEDSPPPAAPSEPPLAAWELEQRANPKPNPYNTLTPISPPQSASLSTAPQQYPGTAQTWKSQSSGHSINGYAQTPISPPQEPLSDDVLPQPPAKFMGSSTTISDEVPPPTPAKYELPLPKRVESLSMAPPQTPEKPQPFSATPAGIDRSSPERPRTSSSRGLSIFPSPSKSQLPPRETAMVLPVPPMKEAELPPPPPQKIESLPTFKPLTLQLSSSNGLAVDKPQPSPGLAPPLSPAFAPGRGGRTETYSFLGDYYFGDNQDDDGQAGEQVNDAAVVVPQKPPSPPRQQPVKELPKVTSGKEADDKMNFRIKSFAPFSLGDFSADFSFDDLGGSGTKNEAPPMPAMPDLKSLPKSGTATSTIKPVTSTPEPSTLPSKADRRSPAIPESIPENLTSDKSLPEAPKTVQRVSSKPELRDSYHTPLQTVAHRSILTSSLPNSRDSSGTPPLPMKDIPEEGPYPSTKPSPLSAASAPGSATSSTVSSAPVNKAGYTSGVSSVRSSSGYTESPSATSSRTSLSSGVNGSTVPTPTPRVPSGEQGPYPARNSSQVYQQRPPSQETVVDRRGPPPGTPQIPQSNRPQSNMHPHGPPQGMPPHGPPQGMPPHGPPQGMPPRGRMPGPPPPGSTPELRGRPGFRPPMNPNFPPRSASPAFSERSMRPPRGPPPPRSASPAFSERRGPPPPRSSLPAFSMRGDPRMRGPPPPGQQQHGRKRSNSMEILDFAVDFELPGSALRFEAKEEMSNRRARSENNRLPPGAFRGRRPESPGPRQDGFRSGSRGPPMPMMPPHMNSPGSRPASRTGSPFRHPPVSHNFNGMPPRGMPGSRRNSGGSNAGGGSKPGSRRPSISEADLDIALGVGQIPGQERKYRPPPQMRGGRPPQGPMPGHMPPQGGRGLKSLNGGGLVYPGLDDGFGMMDGGRMPAPAMPRREEMA